MLTPVFGQKIKYKDIFSLLNAKQYDAAEPFLKRYIAETTDNPNAWLYLGILYEHKAGKIDVLRNTEQAVAVMDSAILSFNNALSMVNEKEIKKNAEYYSLYSRTDLRTGNYGVKLSDVQFDLRKRIEALRERTDKVKMVKYFFSRSQAAYQRCYDQYKALQEAYPGLRELYLRSDNHLIEQLKTLALRYDSAAKDYDNFRTSVLSLDKAGYKPVWNPRLVQDFKNDGTDPADFYSNEPLIWNYGKFANDAVKNIQEKVVPIRQELIAYDIEINRLAEKLQKDSVSVKSDLTRLVQNLLGDKLRSFDEQPMPLDILAVKVADLEYRSARVDTRRYRDSAHVAFQIELVGKELQALNRLDSTLKRASSRNLDEEALNYQDFVSATYNNVNLLKSFVRAQQEYVKKERDRVEKELLRRTKALKWLLSGNDSIPLFNDSSSLFKPLLIESAYTAGIRFDPKGKSEGYFYDIPPSHRPVVRARFAVDAKVFGPTQLSDTRMLATADPSSQIFFALLYSTLPVKGKYSAVVAKIYRLDGLAWNVTHALDFIPQSLKYIPDTGELQINSGGEKFVIIDKSGKIKAD